MNEDACALPNEYDPVSASPIIVGNTATATHANVENLRSSDVAQIEHVISNSSKKLSPIALPPEDDIFIRSWVDMDNSVSPISLVETHPNRPTLLFRAVTPDEMKVLSW